MSKAKFILDELERVDEGAIDKEFNKIMNPIVTSIKKANTAFAQLVKDGGDFLFKKVKQYGIKAVETQGRINRPALGGRGDMGLIFEPDIIYNFYYNDETNVSKAVDILKREFGKRTFINPKVTSQGKETSKGKFYIYVHSNDGRVEV